MYFTPGPGATARNPPQGHRPRLSMLAAVPAISLLAVALPVALSEVALAAGTGGVTISCTNGDPILGPLHSSATLAAGTRGFLQLGGINGGKGQYIGNCTLNGTIPSGWKVAEASWVALTATSGSGNAGTFTLGTGDTAFVDSGTFTNSGTFEDDSSGLTQMIEVGDFMNTGKMVTAGGAFGTAGAAYNPPCPKCTFVDKGTVQVDPKQGFSSGSIFVLAPGGTIDAKGSFGIANESTFDVEGGSVTAGVPTSTQYLGLSEPTIKFGAGLASVSKGTIDITSSADLQGVIPEHWALDVSGGSVTASNSGNEGTFLWDHDNNSTFSDATTFVNSGTFTDTTSGWSQQVEVSRFVNRGTVTSDAPGFGMSGASGITGPVFVNYGDLVIEPKASFGAAGTFDLAGGAVINRGGFGIGKSVLQVNGGSLLGNPTTDVYSLGGGPATVTFEPSVSASSAGRLVFGTGLTINGVIPKKWVLDNIGGPGDALNANHSGNKGTVIWNANAALTATGPFVNSGTFNVTYGSFELAAHDFVNAAGSKMLVNDDSGISASGNFHNDGSFELGAGNRAAVAGNYSQASGASFAVGAAGNNFSVGSLSVGGTASLSGALIVNKMAGLKVATGDAASVVTAHAVSGRFKPVSGLTGGGSALQISYSPGAVTLALPKAG
jgi:adhesin HecA-like repeat protein